MPTKALTAGLRSTASAKMRDLLFGIYHNIPISPETNIFQRDWEVLVILDACRVDALESVSESYDFIRKIDTLWSTGSTSKQWMEETFSAPADTQQTAYVTGNPYSEQCLEPSQFAVLDEVWRYKWDDDLGTIRPRPLTDRAIDTWTEHQPERMIVHYMQPHFPSIPDPVGSGIPLETFGKEGLTVWEDLRKGTLPRDRAWESYINNLRFVLDDVQLLLENIHAEEVVLSADHGNAFGDWGVYGHPVNKPLPVLRRVPWVRTKAHGGGSYTPKLQREQSDTGEVTDRLQDLGYL